MTGFRTVLGPGPLKAVVVGAGHMGREWMRAILRSPDAVVVGVVDLDQSLAARSMSEVGVSGELGTETADVVRRTGADFVVNATVPAAHAEVTLEALRVGVPVLGEKPLTPTVAEAWRLVAAARQAGELFMVSQSRRYHRSVTALRERAVHLGGAAILRGEFLRELPAEGFRATMPDPLLVDMAIHHFDAARFIIGTPPLRVFCDGFNPPRSGFAGNAAAVATVEFVGGARFVYSGAWCAPGFPTSWNAQWRLSGATGTAVWDGYGDIDVDATEPLPPLSGTDPGVEIDGALMAFVSALRTGETPANEVRDNILTLAMIEAAVASSIDGVPVHVRDVLEISLEEARGTESEAVLAEALDELTVDGGELRAV